MSSTGKNILNRFKVILGEYCAINQFLELSKRCFIADHAEDLKTRSSFIDLAHKNHICLTNYDSDAMIGTIARSYIVNVNLCFETFLKELCNDAQRLGVKSFTEKDQKDSWLIHAKKNILDGAIPDDKKALFAICEYYRLIRNTAVHDLCDIDLHHKQFKMLQKYTFKTDSKFENLSAPNTYENISFDDFVMFSRSCGELATYLFNSVNYDYAKIISDMPEDQFKKFRKYSDERLQRAIISYLKNGYNTDDRLTDQLQSLCEQIKA